MKFSINEFLSKCEQIRKFMYAKLFFSEWSGFSHNIKQFYLHFIIIVIIIIIIIIICFSKVARVVNIKLLFYGLVLLWFHNTN